MKIKKYILSNSQGMEIQVINLGGIITSIKVPDKNGVIEDVILGFDEPARYTDQHPYFGALIGRYANRIANGEFHLGEKSYQLAINNGPNHLHGGLKGFDKRIWNIEEQPEMNALVLSYLSPDGEEGYPGNLSVEVTYTVSEHNELKIDYVATTDTTTPLNLTSHCYFNLSGNNKSSILDHELLINADEYTLIDHNLTPTGGIGHVKNSEMDFTRPKKIGDHILSVKVGFGFDHNYILRDTDGSLKLAARLHEPVSGRTMEVLTTEPGLQFYSGNFLDGSLIGKKNDLYEKHDGLCLETQHFPDSPNHRNFPSTLLHPGEPLHSRTIYRFLLN